MKKIVRLTEQDLHRIVKESVNRVIKEWDEYNEFDRNGDASDMSPSYERYEHMRIKLLREPYSKKNEQMLLKYLKQNTPEECKGLYDQLGDKYPKFKRAWEIENSWYNNEDFYDLPSSEDIAKMKSYGTNPDDERKPARVGTGRDFAAVLGAKGGIHPAHNQFKNIDSWGQAHKNPANVRNVNIYNPNPKGKYAMKALSHDTNDQIIGKSVRSSMKDTYDTAKRMHDN